VNTVDPALAQMRPDVMSHLGAPGEREALPRAGGSMVSGTARTTGRPAVSPLVPVERLVNGLPETHTLEIGARMYAAQQADCVPFPKGVGESCAHVSRSGE
jgi:hypothetical protein